IGLSAFSRQSAGSLLVIVANNTLAAYGGNLAIAVFGVINRLMRFTLMPVFGIAQGFQPVVGYNYGAGSYANIIKAVRRGILYASLVSVAGFLLFMLLPGTLMSIFSDEPELIHQGKIALRLMSLALPLVGYQVLGATIFLSIGKALPSFLLTMSRQFLFLIPLILFLPRYLGIRGVWIAFPLSDILSFLITLIFVIRILAEFKLEIKRRENEISAT
ncbi:MAG: MATE family efflux transporter, partial [Candidatus Cloacimonetes bacterium]|nr:MATE family efflux transporter [Candidatus Cloacimonadota bacterium]